MSYADELVDTIDAMFSASVIPRRSVDRIRRALAEGGNPELYLDDIERGMQQIAALYDEHDERKTCTACGGTGADASTREEA